MYLIAKKAEIAQRRKAMGYSQSALSEKAGLGHAAVYRMEEMNHRIHPLRAKAVADVLGCSVDELFEKAEKKIS